MFLLFPQNAFINATEFLSEPLLQLRVLCCIIRNSTYQPAAWRDCPCAAAGWLLHWESEMRMHIATCLNEQDQGCTRSSSQTDRNSLHVSNSW